MSPFVLAVAGLLAVAVLAALGFAVAAHRRAQGSGGQMAQMADTAHRLAEAQAVLTGRLSQMADAQAAAQARMEAQLRAQENAVGKLLEARLADVTHRVGESLQQTSEKTQATMAQLHERLAVIDAAQKNITTLSEDVVDLQTLLSNKQARGAIGQQQMEDVVRNMLPATAFEFQCTLSNGKRADCVIRLPNPPGVIAVDSKYPLDAYGRLMAATDERERTAAEAAFRGDVIKHIRDIAEKYIIPGETADQAIMFVPAESVFAELHDRFPMVVEEGFRRKVYIVSPTTLMATLNTVRAILKDARMREQAHIIQQQIGELMKDVVRLDKRVGQLATHFEQARRDVDEIGTSTRKIVKRGLAIENIQLETPAPDMAMVEDGAEGADMEHQRLQ